MSERCGARQAGGHVFPRTSEATFATWPDTRDLFLEKPDCCKSEITLRLLPTQALRPVDHSASLIVARLPPSCSVDMLAAMLAPALWTEVG